MKFSGMNLIWYRPRPKGYAENNRPPDKPSKVAHIFGGPNAPGSLCGRWICWHTASKRSTPAHVPRCKGCVRLLRKLKQRPVGITLGGITYQRSLDYQMYETRRVK